MLCIRRGAREYIIADCDTLFFGGKGASEKEQIVQSETAAEFTAEEKWNVFIAST